MMRGIDPRLSVAEANAVDEAVARMEISYGADGRARGVLTEWILERRPLSCPACGRSVEHVIGCPQMDIPR